MTIHLPTWFHQPLPPLPDQPLTEYWITFTRSTHWTGKLLKKNYGHVYVTTRDQFNWIVLNPQRAYMRIEIAPYPVTHDVPMMLAMDGDTVIKLVFHPRHTVKQFRYLGGLHCLTYAKYLLGLPLGGVTPYAFSKKLLSLSKNDQRALRLESVELIKRTIS